MRKLGIIANQKDLGQKLGYSNESYFSQIINGKVAEPKDFINQLKSLYPELDENWLLTGQSAEGIQSHKGDVDSITEILPADLVEDIKEKIREDIWEEAKEEAKEELVATISVPIVSEGVSVSSNTDLESYIEKNNDDLEQFNLAEVLTLVQVAKRINTSSMRSVLDNGDLAFLKFIDPDSMVSGNTYFFELEGLPRMPRIVKFEGDKLRLIATNPKYDDIVVTKDRVKGVAEIVFAIRFNFNDTYSDVDDLRKQKEEQIKHMIDAQNSQVNSFLEQFNKFNEREDKMIKDFSERENRLIDMLEKKL
jgi:hypothetical protein